MTELYSSIKQRIKEHLSTLGQGFTRKQAIIRADKSKKLLLFCCLLPEMAQKDLYTRTFLNVVINTF